MKLNELLKNIPALPYLVADHEGEEDRAILSGDGVQPTMLADCYADTYEDLSFPQDYRDVAHYLTHAANMLPKLLAAATLARDTLVALSERAGGDDPFWNEGGAGHAAYIALAKACNKAENVK